jgi:hypothetical protein
MLDNFDMESVNNARWGENFNIANKMFVEAGVKIIYIE